jgi:hypothetical protein
MVCAEDSGCFETTALWQLPAAEMHVYICVDINGSNETALLLCHTSFCPAAVQAAV